MSLGGDEHQFLFLYRKGSQIQVFRWLGAENQVVTSHFQSVQKLCRDSRVKGKLHLQIRISFQKFLAKAGKYGSAPVFFKKRDAQFLFQLHDGVGN